jgi:hypothetical protein
MRYIEQEHSEGCMIAAIAMVLDMIYEEAQKAYRCQTEVRFSQRAKIFSNSEPTTS